MSQEVTEGFVLYREHFKKKQAYVNLIKTCRKVSSSTYTHSLHRGKHIENHVPPSLPMTAKIPWTPITLRLLNPNCFHLPELQSAHTSAITLYTAAEEMRGEAEGVSKTEEKRWRWEREGDSNMTEQRMNESEEKREQLSGRDIKR